MGWGGSIPNVTVTTAMQERIRDGQWRKPFSSMFRYSMGLRLRARGRAGKVSSHKPQLLKQNVREPVWPSGKALGW